MKNILLILCAALLSLTATAKDKTKASIQWRTIEEVAELSKKEPKQILVSVYTTWCGYCKKMDKRTYNNPLVIAYINEHFYAVKIDAEQATPIQFNGQSYGLIPYQGRPVNALLHQWMQGQMSYPTTIMMDAGFVAPIAQPGYLDVLQMEQVLKYRGTGAYKELGFGAFARTMKPTWK